MQIFTKFTYEILKASFLVTEATFWFAKKSSNSVRILKLKFKFDTYIFFSTYLYQNFCYRKSFDYPKKATRYACS